MDYILKSMRERQSGLDFGNKVHPIFFDPLWEAMRRNVGVSDSVRGALGVTNIAGQLGWKLELDKFSNIHLAAFGLGGLTKDILAGTLVWDKMRLVFPMDRFSGLFDHNETLHKAISLSVGTNAFARASTQAFSIHNHFEIMEMAMWAEKTLLGMPKQSRLLSYSEKAQRLLKINYDLTKVIEVSEEAEERGIILQRKQLLEANTVRKTIQEIYKNNTHLYKIKARQFEEVIAELLYKKGYTVELTKQTRDGGYDIIAVSDDNGMPLKYLVECKRYAKNRPVGIEIVRSFSDVIREENANKGIIFTTSYFSTDVHKRHKANPYILDLKDHDEVIRWVENYMAVA